MKDKTLGQWRGVSRKLKQARRRKEKIIKKLGAIPIRNRNVRAPFEEELDDLKITISVLELKEARLRPKDVKQ
jgi:hypothetical protein